MASINNSTGSNDRMMPYVDTTFYYAMGSHKDIIF